jgi:hypothetical protein
MRWISKEPPIYVWQGDTWFNERDGKEYYADISTRVWRQEEQTFVFIDFPKKTQIKKEGQ